MHKQTRRVSETAAIMNIMSRKVSNEEKIIQAYAMSKRHSHLLDSHSLFSQLFHFH